MTDSISVLDRVELAAYPLRNISHIVIHHSATEDTTLENFDAICDYHREVNGWQDIGYHAVGEYVADSTVAQYGRPEHIQGAHVAGFNETTLGVCIVGNFDKTIPSYELLAYVVWRIVVPWCVQYSIPIKNVVGHCEVPGVTKTCPGTNFNMDKFRDLVNTMILKQTYADAIDSKL